MARRGILDANLIRRAVHPLLESWAVVSGIPPSAVASKRQVTSDASGTLPAGSPAPQLRFDDHQAIFSGRSTPELLRALLVFRICGIPAFVNNSETLLSLGRKTIGERATNYIIKHTFFAHFCAGENEKEVWSSMSRLRARGVGAILDYAAEDDAEHPPPPEKLPQQQQSQAPTPQELGRRRAVARTYDYQSELLCDKHVDTFLNAIDTAAMSSLPGQGFAAVKLTGLGNPLLLERISTAVRTVRGLFHKFDTDGSGFVDRSEFDTAWHAMFPDCTAAELDSVFAHLDVVGDGRVDYVSWCQRLSLKQLPRFADRIRKSGATSPSLLDFSEVCLDDEEVALVEAMRGRLRTITERALLKDVGLMIDAEHTYFQPAIDHLTLQLMREHNQGDKPHIFNTYQAYLVDSAPRMIDDMERASREGYKFGCKLVRGAYLHLERRRAQQMGYPSPVWGTLEETHANYDKCLDAVMLKAKAGQAEVVLGTHNQTSVELAVKRMADLGIDPADRRISFGQLLGMSDHLTFTLGMNGYPAFKYVPYGTVHEVVPYLLRRASENAFILKSAKADVRLLQAELWRRLSPLGLFGRIRPKAAKASVDVHMQNS